MTIQRKTAEELAAERLQTFTDALIAAGADPDTAEDIATKMIEAGYQDPDKKKPKLLPKHPLDAHIGRRPPWFWPNLDDDPAEFLDECLDEFVNHHNQHLTTRPEDVIPGCWRQHNLLNQVVPTLFWTFYLCSKAPDASPHRMLDVQLRQLPMFHALLSDTVPAPCRQPAGEGGGHMGLHPDHADAIVTAMNPAPREPGDRARLQGTWFGTR